MISINTNISSNLFKPKSKLTPNETELGLFYTNDMHGDVNRLSKFKTAHDMFVKSNKNNSTLTLAAGDCLFGSDKLRNSLMVKLFNLMGLDALALGNHEFAGGTKALSKSIDKAEFKTVSSNLQIKPENPLLKNIEDKKLVKSAVFMKGGHKFAVIGASPFNSYISTVDKNVKVKDLDRTIDAINEETKKLEQQGVNKIILLSHLGYENADIEVAKRTEGVDIIVGGHTHTKIDGVNTKALKNNAGANKQNLFKSKRNEPVLITQAGGMNQYVGYVNAIFDNKGVLKTKKTTNQLISLDQFENSSLVDKLMDKELGKKEKLADINGSYTPKGSFTERFKENPLANAFADAMLNRAKKYGAEVALFHAATVRGGIEGQITNYDVKYSMLPFNNDLYVVDISEKDLVQLLKNMSGSILTSEKDAQLLRCAGMEYSVRNDKEYFLNGGKNPIENLKIGDREINTEQPNENKTIKVAINAYLYKHSQTKGIMAKYKKNTVKIGNEQETFIEYLKKNKVVDCTKKEERIKLSSNIYQSSVDIEKARQEVISALNI